MPCTRRRSHPEIAAVLVCCPAASSQDATAGLSQHLEDCMPADKGDKIEESEQEVWSLALISLSRFATFYRIETFSARLGVGLILAR
jgi:hypothetical protein